MSKHSAPEDDWLPILKILGVEFLATVMILNTLREADIDGKPGKTDDDWFAVLMMFGIALRDPEELRSSLSSAELKKLRSKWEAEVTSLARPVWEKHASTLISRYNRWRAQLIVAQDNDPRIGARLSKAALELGRADAASIIKLLKGKKSQGGILDIDKELLRQESPKKPKFTPKHRKPSRTKR